MNTLGFSVRRTTPDDWREIRELRLEMIRDTPTGYAESLETALQNGEADWRLRGARGQSEQGIAVAAITTAGTWVGTMGGYILDAETGPLLVGVYVTPEYRGREVRVMDALLTSVEDWARAHGNTLTLHVHEGNARARRAYEARGFTATGHSVPYNLDPTALELEMRKQF